MPEVTLTEVKKLVGDIGHGFEEFKSENDKNLKQRDALIEEKLKKIGDDIASKHETATKALAVLEGRLNRPPLSPQQEETNQKHLHAAQLVGKAVKNGLMTIDLDGLKAYDGAFHQYIGCSQEAMLDPDVRKALSVGSDPDGGYWVAPPEVDGSIRTRIFETSPMQQVCSTQQISTHEYKVQQDPNELTAGWVGETQTRPNTTTPQVATKVITAHELYAQPAITRIMLEDAAVNVEAWLTDKVADKMARLRNTAFLWGNGVAQPRGLLTYPAGTNSDGSNKWGEIEQIVSGASGTFAYDSLITLITSLKDNFQAGAQFLVRRQSLAAIMTLKDGAGRYIFMPILNGAFNNTPLLGYQLHYASDMQATGTSGNILMAFGDFKQAYLIVERVGTSMIRDEVTQKPFVLYYTRQRVGGDVVNYDAVKLYKAS